MVDTLHLRVSNWQCFVILLLFSVQAIAEELCSEKESVNITNGTEDRDGNIVYDGVSYNPSQYFKDENVTRGCICVVRQCIYVCDAENITRVELTELYANVADTSGKNISLRNLATDDRYHLILEEPQCNGYWLALEPSEVIITSKGDLNLSGDIFNYLQFCMQPMNEMGEFHVLYCESETSELPHNMYAFGFLANLPFLVATFVVYAIIPELRNVSGMSVMCYVTALAVSYLLLALARLDIYDYQSNMCIFSGYLLYFTLMASFFWLNIMCLDIYWTFSGSCGRTTERRKIFLYCLYAWGVPLLFLSVVLLFDHTELISYDLRPNVGEEGCFLKEEMRNQFLYLYMPLMQVISTNIFLLAITAKRIYNDNTANHTACREDRNRFVLYLRLFTVMGVLWTLEIISWLLTESTSAQSWLIYVLDVFNCLAGIVIFFLLVCNQSVRKLLLHRFCSRVGASESG